MSHPVTFSTFLYELWIGQLPKNLFVMFVLWLTFLKSRIECTVDFGWCLNHFIVGLFMFINYQGSYNSLGLIQFGLLAAWFAALGGQLFFRMLSGYRDIRYQKLHQKSKIKDENMYFLYQYEFQALLVIFTGIPLWFVFRNPAYSTDAPAAEPASITFIIGSLMSAVGIALQFLADKQLRDYKAKRQELNGKEFENREKLLEGENSRFPGQLTTGLWSKSRHPNLFFELVIWFGFGISGLSTQIGFSFLSLLGPTLLWAIMNYLTVPITEKCMALKRPYWKEYVSVTNKFLPF